MIGNILKKLREEKGLKQEELAKILSVSPSAIGMYETNKREPNNELTIKIANYFNVSTDYILGITSHKNPKEDLEKQLSDFFLTEEEYNSLINTFNVENEIKKYLKNICSNQNDNNREITIIRIILQYVFDYIPEIPLYMNQEEEEQFDMKVKWNLLKAKSLLNSLDKSKIIHNYKDKGTQEFKFAYHKEMEGLTDEEIADALRFYKEMKKRVEKDNK